MTTNRIVIVGLGGIGSWVLQALVPFCAHHVQDWHFILVDGDEYEDKNRSRQVFTDLGAKAVVQASMIARSWPQVTSEAITDYLSADGADGTRHVREVIRSGDMVLSCVDNHKTRKVLADHCTNLRDVVLISGGNDYTDGNVQVFVRQGGESKTCSPGKYHPEIASPQDKAPYELSCEELANSAPQLIFANMTAAALMCGAFYAHTERRLNWGKSEVYFDVPSLAAIPRERVA